MIDLHCHLLPAIDDGPATLQEALSLARLAVANGITHAILTPHIQPGLYENDSAGIDEAFKRFSSALQEAGIPLRVDMAAEVRISMEMLGMIEEERIPFLGELDGYRIILLEFPHSHILPGTEKLIDHLLRQHIRPMIAHPERNKDVIRRLEKLHPLVSQGCMLQLTADSLAGRFGAAVEHRSREMLAMGWVDVLATDAHNRFHRPPRLEPGRRVAEGILGESASWDLVRHLPARLTRNRFGGQPVAGN